MQADDADVERLRRERASLGAAVASEPLPGRFFKLPRIRFLLVLCQELARISQHIDKVRLPAGGAGCWLLMLAARAGCWLQQACTRQASAAARCVAAVRAAASSLLQPR